MRRAPIRRARKVAAPAATFFAVLVMGGASSLAAQQTPQEGRIVRVDSIAVEGNRRVARTSVLARVGIDPGSTATLLDIQRAAKSLWATGQFSDVEVHADEVETPEGPKVVLTFVVVEQPLVRTVVISGLEHADEGEVRDSSGLRGNVPFSPQAVERAREIIRTDLSEEGIPFARIEHRLETVVGLDNTVDVFLDVTEGKRVTVADVAVRGNEALGTDDIAGAMSTKPEGFWWFRPGSYDPERYESDLQGSIPQAYTSRGYLDFRVLSDTVIVDPETGKARIEIEVDEGPRYRIAELEIEGNQYFPDERLERLFRSERGGLLRTIGLGGGEEGGELAGQVFDAVRFEAAVEEVAQLYRNEGYIFAQVQPFVEKRQPAAPGEEPTVRIGVAIREGSPATVNTIAIQGNDYTHEWVIRDKIFLLPGDTYSQDRVLQSWQSIGSLGFFDTPLPVPDIVPDEETGLVDITFKVKERQTGAVNFGTSVGGGTGLAGFIGYDQPNLFGQAKEAHLRWDFGRWLNNFTLSFSDPALYQSRVSGTVQLFNSTNRFFQFRNGTMRRIGGSLRFGLPIPGDPRTRIFTGYSLSRTKLRIREGVDDVSLFGQPDGIQSQVMFGVTRSTLNHPLFPYNGSRLSWNVELNGGIFGGDGDFTKHTVEGSWWVPVAQVGDAAQGRPIIFALGLTVRGGGIFGEATRFPFDQFWMGGVQFGQQLRGYDETSITPVGFFPERGAGVADVNRLGKGFISLTAEYAMRLNDNISLSTFFDAGNIWAEPQEIDPTRLFRGAGVGLQLVTPFGPIGIDYAYGFDKTVPGWQLHFRMGPGF